MLHKKSRCIGHLTACKLIIIGLFPQKIASRLFSAEFLFLFSLQSFAGFPVILPKHPISSYNFILLISLYISSELAQPAGS